MASTIILFRLSKWPHQQVDIRITTKALIANFPLDVNGWKPKTNSCMQVAIPHPIILDE
jgi:hypothetical protein